MIITISGKPGSGKSTIAERLARALGVPRYYIGGLRRKMAADRGLTLEALNALGEKQDWTDREVDEYQRTLGQTEHNFVIEGRTSFHFIPHSLKLFFDVAPEVGAQRVFNDFKSGRRTPESSGNATLDDVRAMLNRRIASDVLRYQQYYGIENIYDPKHYDAVIDTTNLTPDQMFDRVMDVLQRNGRKTVGKLF